MNRDLFFNFFPVPKYLELPSVGIDISDNCVRYVEINKSGGRLKLGKYGKRVLGSEEKPYEHDETIEDSRLGRILSEIKEKNNFESVNASLPEDQAYFLKLRLPGVEASEIHEAIELQIEDHVPYSAEEVIFDYEIINAGEKVSHIDVAVSVIPKIVSEKYITTLNLSGYKVSSLVIESDAITKAVVPRGSKEAHIVVNVGKNKTVISIVNGGTVWISDTIKAGGDLLTGLISKYLKVDLVSAEDMKFKNGLSEIKDNLVFEPLALGLSSIRDEISRYHTYWTSNKEEVSSGDKQITQIILCGKDANIPGIDNYLSSSLRLPTVIANPWVNVESFEKHIPDMPRKDSLEYATAIGLALNNLF